MQVQHEKTVRRLSVVNRVGCGGSSDEQSGLTCSHTQDMNHMTVDSRQASWAGVRREEGYNGLCGLGQEAETFA